MQQQQSRSYIGSAGFEGAQESALDLLGELALRYVGEVGAAAHGYAELAGRSSVTFSDAVSVCSLLCGR